MTISNELNNHKFSFIEWIKVLKCKAMVEKSYAVRSYCHDGNKEGFIIKNTLALFNIEFINN